MHWRNSRFQVVHFLLGKCHTIDEAYREAMQLREERHVAIESAGVPDWRWFFLSKAQKDQSRAAFAEAVRERDFLDVLLAKMKEHPSRKYRHLPDHEAHQACQRDEWKLRLIHRAKTFMLTTGTIPQDQLETMMQHPDFKSEIAPAIEHAEKNRSLTMLPEQPQFIQLLGGPDGL